MDLTGTGPAEPGERLERIRAHYDAMAAQPPPGMEHTWQGGLLAGRPGEVIHATNLYLARRAGLRPGMRVLDAGCGAGGPAVDIARHIPGLTIEGVTASAAEAEAARAHVERNGLSGRVRVREADFHRLPYPDGTFDAALLIESACHSADQTALFGEMSRVLRPGGRLYVKDVFLGDRPLSDAERRALVSVNERFQLRLRRLDETAAAIAGAGFAEVRPGERDVFDIKEYRRRMRRSHAARNPGSDPPESPFALIPLHFADVLATRRQTDANPALP
ncbi:SAM-dependent methyltransferase [Bailinhaonella thermotolerans]|uniref:Class I SAM-dependent methyltransferase n=1 Tax=Bailinhaonella thermotolerans TaxID=1070861 RepID=A0A3A4BA71_9ACTN|nr:class I SAM-dependent methyltransferase [Bailinhaonella thermotolerans]RJL35809.1 class I SAM-dependent methyltransferase [Bailinhaonella thermotolerans]